MQAKLIRDSRHESSRIIMPLDANPMGNAYGGSLLRYIDEVAAVSATRHARLNAVTASIEHMDFLEPVFVGDLLVMKAAVIHTGRTSMIVGVKVEAENLKTGRRVKTGVCYLTFVALDERRKPHEVPSVTPSDPEEVAWHDRGRKLYEFRKARMRAEG